MRDYQESVTTGQTHTRTDAGQSNPYVPLCFAGDTKTLYNKALFFNKLKKMLYVLPDMYTVHVCVFSAPEPKAQVHYCDHALSVVRPSVVRPSVRPSLTFHIFDFFSETAERNSTKLDRKQDLNVLYQVCVFRADRKNKMAALASDWLRHFRLLL